MQKHRLDDLSDLKLSQLMHIPRKSLRKAQKKKHTRSEGFGCMAWLKSSQTQPQIHGIPSSHARPWSSKSRVDSGCQTLHVCWTLHLSRIPSTVLSVWNAKPTKPWVVRENYYRAMFRPSTSYWTFARVVLLNHQVRSADYILTFILVNYRELLLDYQLFLKATSSWWR